MRPQRTDVEKQLKICYTRKREWTHEPNEKFQKIKRDEHYRLNRVLNVLEGKWYKHNTPKL